MLTLCVACWSALVGLLGSFGEGVGAPVGSSLELGRRVVSEVCASGLLCGEGLAGAAALCVVELGAKTGSDVWVFEVTVSGTVLGLALDERDPGLGADAVGAGIEDDTLCGRAGGTDVDVAGEVGVGEGAAGVGVVVNDTVGAATTEAGARVVLKVRVVSICMSHVKYRPGLLTEDRIGLPNRGRKSARECPAVGSEKVQVVGV